MPTTAARSRVKRLKLAESLTEREELALDLEALRDPKGQVPISRDPILNCSGIGSDVNGLSPLLLTFPQGPPPASVLNNSSLEGLNFRYYKGESGSGDGLDVESEIHAGAPHLQVTYFATSCQKEGGLLGVKESRYVVGIYNKKKNEVKLVDTPSLFVMQQSIRGYKRVLEDYKNDGLNIQEKRDLLIKNFASTRTQKMMVNKKVNEVDTNSHFGLKILDMEGLKEEGNVGSCEMMVSQAHREDLPIFNSQTQVVEDIYLIDHLVPAGCLDFIVESNCPCVIALTDKKRFDSLSGKVSNFVFTTLTDICGRVNNLRHIKNKDEVDVIPLSVKRKVALLQYTGYLLTLFREATKGMVSRDIFEKQVPTTVAEDILKTFAVPRTKLIWKIGKSLKAKLVSYMLIIALTVKNFTMELDVLAQDMLIPQSKLKLYLEHVGCVVKVDESSNRLLATLRAPLKLPTLGFGRQNQRGGG